MVQFINHGNKCAGVLTGGRRIHVRVGSYDHRVPYGSHPATDDHFSGAALLGFFKATHFRQSMFLARACSRNTRTDSYVARGMKFIVKDAAVAVDGLHVGPGA